jgi:hypothetical protein
VRTLVLRSFTGGQLPRLEIGPDVFADALASSSAGAAPGISDFQKPPKPKRLEPYPDQPLSISAMTGRSRLDGVNRVAVVGTRLGPFGTTRQRIGWRLLVSAMVIVLPSGRVN